jgi:two-component sensor histidine kinase
MTVARQVAIGIAQKQDEMARRRAEEELRSNEARLRLAVEAAQLGIWDWNVLTGELVFSARAREIFGFAADTPVTVPRVRDATFPEDLPMTTEWSRRARNPAVREKVPYQFRIVRPDGAVRWIVAHGEVLFAHVGGIERAVRYAGTIQDFTAQKQTADALFQSETRLRLAIEVGRMGVWEYDLATETLVGSPELNRVLGFPPEARPSIVRLRSGYLPGEQERVRQAGQQALAVGNQHFEVEFRYRWPDQTLHWLMLRAEFVFRDGKVNRLVGLLTDVTHLKHAQEQQAFLINELNHRVKNTLATVQSLAVMTLKTKAPAEFVQAFSQRLVALSATHDLLTQSGWEHASLDDVIEVELKPYMSAQITLEPALAPLLLTPKAALSLGLVFHELATNAAKHGALSQNNGRLVVKWDRLEQRGRPHLSVSWRESNGPPPQAKRTAGFGSRLIQSSVTSELAGQISLSYPPTGFHAEIAVPMEALSP